MTYDLVLITGIPGAGKTTTSEYLAQLLAKSAVISGDNLRKIIRAGFKNPAKPWDEETRKQYYLSFKNGSSIAENLINEGFKVIVDDTLHAGDLYLEWAKYFEKFKPLKILLMPSKEIALKRNRERQSHFVDKKVILEVYENFIKHDYSDWTVIDNGEKSVEEIVSEIRKKLSW